METVRIYLSGAMSNISWEEQTKWRRQIQNTIRFGDYDYSKKPVYFDPPQYYNFEETLYKSEREVMEFELSALRKSDLVIVNFNEPKSIGTAMEAMLAKELRIPIIGLNKDKKEIHPWLLECTTRMCDNMEELISHIVEFYLN